MLLTEEKAKTKRCQESFAAATAISPDGAAYSTSWQYPPPLGGNGQQAVYTAPFRCIASDCMAWRWGEWKAHDEWGTPRGRPTKGYCGKAGRTW